MEKKVLFILFILCASSCHKHDWRDDCERHYTTESGGLAQCIKEREARHAAGHRGVNLKNLTGRPVKGLRRAPDPTGRDG